MSKNNRGQLRQLLKKADSVAEKARILATRAIFQIRGKLATFEKVADKLASSASVRDKMYDVVRREMKILARKINTLEEAVLERAGKASAKDASEMSGLEVKYSKKRAEAIAELVTPAQGENLAAVFTDKMADNMIRALREATVASIREQGASGGTLKEQSRDLYWKWSEILDKEKPAFTDASGRDWDIGRYLQMNTRTNAMRVYNDCLADDIARVSPSTHPLARISGGGDPNCDCFNWEGVIISVDGSDKRFPSYDDAREGGCFHPNCVHTLEYIDETADAEEIDLQSRFPVGDVADTDAMDERKYEIDQQRYRDKGMTKDEARDAVDRDNLTASIRDGLVVSGARKIVDALTDEQILAICKDGNPPKFKPIKLTKRERKKMRDDDIRALEKWNGGKRGGVVHIDKETITVKRLLDVCEVKKK